MSNTINCSSNNAKVIWFTGLSGSGKSTMSTALHSIMRDSGIPTFILDGDILRQGLCRDLGFSMADRQENMRRVAEVTKLFWMAGIYVLAAFISPSIQGRNTVRHLFPKGDFIEVFVDAPLSACEGRDPKGLYKKARSGQIKEFTGLDSPYEMPLNPEITLRTAELTPGECLDILLSHLNLPIVGAAAGKPDFAGKMMELR